MEIIQNSENYKRGKTIKICREKKNISIEKTEKEKFLTKKKLQIRELEKEIEKLEKEKDILEQSLLIPNLEVDKIVENSKRLSEVVSLIDEKSFRWMELDELM